MMKYLFAIFSLTILTVVCPIELPQAQDGVALLKIDHGARMAGRGSTFPGSSNDPNAVVFNPAAAAGFEKFTASFGHTEYWENIRLESAFIAAGLSPKLFIHAGIRFAAVDGIENRLFPSAVPIDSFEAHDVSFKGGFAYRINPKLDIGIGAGWIIEKIGSYRGSSFNVDIGARYQATPKIELAASAISLGSSFRLEQAGLIGSNDIALPTTYRIGAAYEYNERYNGAAELVYLDDEAHLHLGAEAVVNEIFSVRAGYMLNYDSKSFTAGATFTKRNISVDYAFMPFSNNLGTSHLFNLNFSL